MYGLSVEYILLLGYAIFIALIALVLELVARHAHKRSATISTVGFTYHPDRDIWQCPQDKHLFPVFSDSVKKNVIYRAPADICNSCPSKTACTDSNNGRTIERKDLDSLQYGMQRFHRAISLTLLTLAGLILAVEACRTTGFFPRLILIVVFFLFGLLALRLFSALSPDQQHR